MRKIARTLYLWRLAKGWSQDELARRMNFPRPNLSNIEKGKQDITVSTLELFAGVFGTTPGTLADGKLPAEAAGTHEMDRETLEKIAQSVAGRSVDLAIGQREIAVLLGRLLQNRSDASKGKFRKRRYPSRLENEAWLRLQALLSPAEIKSLLQRVSETERIHEPTSN